MHKSSISLYPRVFLVLSTAVASSFGCATQPVATGDRAATNTAPASSVAASVAGGAGAASGASATTAPGANGQTPLLPMSNAAAGASGAVTPPPNPSTLISRDPIALDDCGATNPAGLSAQDVQRIKAGSGSPGTMKWLYPYADTVFPRGMLAPDLMWDGPAADAVYVHVQSQLFEYSACLKPSMPGRLTVPQDVWEKAGQRSNGKGDSYRIELTVLGQGAVIGPVTTQIQIAQAAIKGSIYYNTYRSTLAPPPPDPTGLGLPTDLGGLGGASGALNGIVVRIPAGGSAEAFGRTSDCSGCHSVSANGSMLLAQSVGNGAIAYPLSANVMTPAPTMAGMSGAWVGLYPDGSAALVMSTVIDVARAGFGAMADATLIDTKTGQTIMSTGVPKGTLMPFFSPDGSYLVFNDYALGDAHGIALVNYDTQKHTASNYTMLYQEPAGAMRPAWPFVLPDNHGVVFLRTDDGDFTGNGVGVSADVQPDSMAPFAELSIVDVSSKKVTLLAKAMGYNTPEDATTNVTYLPFGAEDLHHAYYPTVSPVGAGGYFWVFFDSVRHYGGTGLQRQLWGAAIDISADGTYTSDPSHPAFYVSGQEFGTGNHRAFAALDPCRKDGDKCSSGIDCCGGYCYLDNAEELTEPVGTCSPKKMECAKQDERCLSAADCCATDPTQPPLACIAGFCAQVRGPD